MAQSLFIALKNRDPACRIDVLAPPALHPLLERMPQIAKAIALPGGFERFGIADCWSFARQIRSFGYSHAIQLSAGWRFTSIPVLARIPVRTGYLPKPLLNDTRAAGHWTVLEKFVAPGLDSRADFPAELALPELDIGLHHQIPVMEKFAIIESREPVLALCPGGGASRGDRWEPEFYASLAAGAVNQGWQVWLLGEETDHDTGIRIGETAQRVQNFIGKTNLAEAIDLLSLADVVLTGYSGLMHIALALKKQVLIIADADRIGNPACRQPGARVLPLDATPELVLSELPGG